MVEKRSEHERVTLRLPPDLHKMLVDAAQSCSPPNSLNYEILERLYSSFDYSPRPGLTIEERYENAANAWRQSIEELQRRLAEVEQKLAEKENER